MAPTFSLGRRWFAFLWSRMDTGVDREAARLKDALFVDLPDNVVELGAGRGSNFRRYPEGGKVIAFEPNHHMHHALRQMAARHRLQLDLRGGGAETLDLADGAQPAVVSTFTLCSVANPTRAMTEIHRVLRPGGRFIFIEHIAGEPGTNLARQQRLMRIPWALVGDRCDLLANTDELIEHVGFASVERSYTILGSKSDPSRRVVFGTAVK